jgi:hypothetical protein
MFTKTKNMSRFFSFIAAGMILISLGWMNKPVSGANEEAAPGSISLYEPSTPITASLKIDPIPLVGEPATLTCTVSSTFDAPGTRVNFELPADAQLLAGSLEWTGDLAADVPVDLPITVAFTDGGKEEIKCRSTRLVNEGEIWGDTAVLYLTIDRKTSFVGYASQTPSEAAGMLQMAAPGDGELLEGAPLVLPEDQPMNDISSFDNIILNHPPDSPEGVNNLIHPLTVTGQISYYNRNNVDTGIWGMAVRILNGSTGAVLAFCYSFNTAGDFSCGPFENPGSAGVRAQALTWVSYAPNNDVVTVINPAWGTTSDIANAYSLNTGVVVLADGTRSIGDWFLGDGIALERAFWMHQDLGDVWRFIYNNGSQYMTSKITAGPATLEWQDGLDPPPNSGDAYYSPHGNIHIFHDEPLSVSVVHHEYGHNIMHNVYGVDYDERREACDPNLDHTYQALGNDGCAWNEGWATFIDLAVRNDPVYRWYDGGILDLEPPTYGTTNWPNNGDTVIGRVTGALWDIYDSVNDGSDESTTSFYSMWDTYTGFHAHNIGNFYTNWLGFGYPALGPVMSIYQNTIDSRLNPAGAFNKSSPTDGAGSQPATVTISWGASSGATSYSYCFDTVNNDTCDGTWVSPGTNLSASITLSSPATTYYWEVRSVKGNSHTYAGGNPTSWRAFTTVALPGAFNKTSPANGATNQSSSVNLVWGTSSNATSYYYCYDTTNDNACSTWVSTGTSASASISGLSPATTYYWHTKATNSFGTVFGNGASTSFWSFTTANLPGSFGKNGPLNAAINQALSLTLSWGAASGATGYAYCYDTTNDNSCTNWTSTGTTTSASLSGLSRSTTYYWHVRATNSIGTTYANGSSTAFWSFTTIPDAPSAFNKSTPINGTAQPTSPTLTWGASTGAASYEICYDTTNDNACSTWTNIGATTSTTLNNLTPLTTFYWHVRSQNPGGTTYSNGSSTIFWSFTTIMNPPAAFDKSTPGNGAAAQPINLTLTWSASIGAESYEVCYDTTNDNDCTSWMNNGTVTSHSLTGLNRVATYYWQVRAINAGGTTYAGGAATGFWFFTTANSPPTLISPANGASLLTNLPTFTWETITGAASYNIQVSRYSNFSSTTINATVASPSYIPTTALTAKTLMYWRVRVNSALGTSVWSNPWSFTTANPPPAPTLATPAANALLIAPTPVRLDWNNVTMPSGTSFQKYEVQVATNATFTVDAILADTAISEYTFGPLAVNTVYYWRVRAYNSLGQYGAWSATRIFRTAILPPNSIGPGNVSPGAAVNVQTRRPTFTWESVVGATGYTVEGSTVVNFSTKAFTTTTSNTTYTHTADLAANKQYYWRVKANGPNGPSLYSEVRTFTTGNPPSVPILSTPANNALVTTLTPLLDWSNATVPAGSPAFHGYEVQIAGNNTFTTGLTNISVPGLTSNSQVAAPVLLNGATYYWHVRSVNVGMDGVGGNEDDHVSGWSLVRSLRVPFAPPTLSLPLTGAIGLPLKPAFSWSAISGATTYTLQVSKVPTFATLAVNKTITAPATTYTPTVNLTANTLYYWRVRVNGPYGPGMWSTTFTFTTQ